MKEIKAFIHKQRIGAVIEVLRELDLHGGGGVQAARNINVGTVMSLLPAIDAREQRYSLDLGGPVIQEYKLELLCEDQVAETIAKAIAAAAATGQEEAGWVYASDVQAVIWIGRNGEP